MAAAAGLDRRAAGRARESLDAAIGVLAAVPMSTSLYSGFPGIAWAADMVGGLVGRTGTRDTGTRDGSPGERVSGGTGPEDRNGDIDAALAAVVLRYPERGAYDLIDGLAGIGAYALARWPRPAAAACLDGVVERLAARARRDGDGVHWWTGPDQLIGPRARQYPDGGVDLGMAHGIAGLIPLLARAHTLGAHPRAVRSMLDGTVRWLLAHLIETPAGHTAPGFVARDTAPVPARMAWCYGDPGVAMALLLAGRDAGEPAWTRAGTELALAAAARTPAEAGVSDAGICHGSAGLAHLFCRMYQLTGEQRLADAAVTWAERTIARCTGQDGGHRGDEAAGQGGGRSGRQGAGLLEGTAGVALVLLAACYPVEPAWDQLLFGVPVAVAAPREDGQP